MFGDATVIDRIQFDLLWKNTHNMQFATLTIFSVQLSGTKYNHIVVQTHTTIHLQNFFVFPNRNYAHSTLTSHLSYPQPQKATILFYVSINFLN